MSKKEIAYNAEDIQTLEIMQHIRLRPGMYCGSVSLDGLHHIILEIFSNSIDEFLMGYGKSIEVILDKDKYIQINDDARGIPHGIHKDGMSTLQAAFGVANTGGKYDDSGDSGYNSSGGMHGIGAKTTNALSSPLIVASTRSGKTQIVKFDKGEFVSFNEVPAKNKDHTGTSVRFRPDPEIFDTIEIDKDRLRTQLIELSFLSKGLEIILIDRRTEKVTKESIKSDKGILDYLGYLNKKKKPLTTPFYLDGLATSPGVEVGFMYNDSYSDTVRLYTNNIPNSQGTHLSGFRSALTRSINEFGRKHGFIKLKDVNLNTDDLKEGLVLVLNLRMKDPVYHGQTKENLTSQEARSLTESLVKPAIAEWLESHVEDGQAIIEKALVTRRAKEAAKKAREIARKIAPTTTTNVAMPGKLADCSSTNIDDNEIYLVEGE